MFEKVGVCKKLTFGKMKLCRIMMKIFTHYSVLVVPSRSLQKADFGKSGTLSKRGGGDTSEENCGNIAINISLYMKIAICINLYKKITIYMRIYIAIIAMA